jgi:high-affinity nickel permease
MQICFVPRTGLGFQCTEKFVLLEVVSRPRAKESKQLFYRLLSEKLLTACGIPTTDVMVSFVINGDDDWSFGGGRAQFLTGEL